MQIIKFRNKFYILDVAGVFPKVFSSEKEAEEAKEEMEQEHLDELAFERKSS